MPRITGAALWAQRADRPYPRPRNTSQSRQSARVAFCRVDLARLGIGTTGELLVGVNLDSAESQGVDISEAVMAEAVAVIESGGTTKLHPEVLAAIARRGRIIPLEQRQADDKAWLESLHCTDEMIAEQQAALDAAE